MRIFTSYLSFADRVAHMTSKDTKRIKMLLLFCLSIHVFCENIIIFKNSDPHLLSAFIQEKVGKTTRDWAQEVLFNKLEITNLEWRAYKDGVTLGAFGILTTPREMGKIGQLILNDGMWKGEQIVSKNWLDEMTSAKVSPNETPFDGVAFGYMWWKDIERNVSFAAGHGGQYILVNKDKNLVVVITSERHTVGEHNLSVYEALSIFDMVSGGITE